MRGSLQILGPIYVYIYIYMYILICIQSGKCILQRHGSPYFQTQKFPLYGFDIIILLTSARADSQFSLAKRVVIRK